MTDTDNNKEEEEEEEEEDEDEEKEEEEKQKKKLQVLYLLSNKVYGINTLWPGEMQFCNRLILVYQRYIFKQI